MSGKNRRRILHSSTSLEHRLRQISQLASDRCNRRNPNQIEPRSSQQPSSADDARRDRCDATCNRALNRFLRTQAWREPSLTESASTIVGGAIAYPDNREKQQYLPAWHEDCKTKRDRTIE